MFSLLARICGMNLARGFTGETEVQGAKMCAGSSMGFNGYR
jgi:hypothetical protein